MPSVYCDNKDCINGECPRSWRKAPADKTFSSRDLRTKYCPYTGINLFRKIKEMTTEELAVFLAQIELNVYVGHEPLSINGWMAKLEEQEKGEEM